MKQSLLKSLIVILLFWGVVTTVYWSVQQPSVNYAALAAVKHMFPFLPFSLPASATITGSLAVQLKVFLYWSLPILALTAISFIVGYLLIWKSSRKEMAARERREAKSDVYRGISSSRGNLPVLAELPRDEIELSSDEAALENVTTEERELLSQILGTASAAEGAYSPYKGDSLLEAMLKAAEVGLSSKKTPGLCAIAATAPMLGNIVAYEKKANGEFSRTKNVSVESTRIMAAMPAWYAMQEPLKSATLLAVRFRDNPREMPSIGASPQAYKLAWEAIAALNLAVKAVEPAPSAPSVSVPTQAPSVNLEKPSAGSPSSPEKPARRESDLPRQATAHVPPPPAPVKQPSLLDEVLAPANLTSLKEKEADVSLSSQGSASSLAPPEEHPSFGDSASVFEEPPVAPATPVEPTEAIRPKLSWDDEPDAPTISLEGLFLRYLPTMSFQTRGQPKGVAAVAWKVKNRVYMVEGRLRELLETKLTPELKAEVRAFKEKTRTRPLIAMLLKELDAKGWLVKSADGVSILPAAEALWTIKAGKLEFKGVIAIDVPEDYLEQLPPGDSMYEISVVGPLFYQNTAGMEVMSRASLMSSVLKNPSPKEEQPPKEVTPSE
jgi:hypothetical protein